MRASVVFSIIMICESLIKNKHLHSMAYVIKKNKNIEESSHPLQLH